ncbi:hypothetical protein UA75_20230 [Actinoalloteichus sp. GBA129-24]|uniref:Uncharacterized protein n=2 Tax=Pseudonocardiaceae TaxID=2070 RepID=A0AAC9LFL1_9PSEU|nr:hypothetical protein UA74_19720 [Actinoalloteichus fjordicus]APU22035.1 hypothetical protein UA75_20230 [Actinoalloteichus sp. GBA129-24]
MGQGGEPVNLAILTGYTMPPMYFDARDGEYYNRTVDEAADFFGLSRELARELNDWNREYQKTFNIDVPQDSKFESEELFVDCMFF